MRKQFSHFYPPYLVVLHCWYLAKVVTYQFSAGSLYGLQFIIYSLTLRITGWQWSAAELPVRVDAVVI